MSPKRLLITGAAGFIGSAYMREALHSGFDVHGVDNFSEYYSPDLKNARLRALNLESAVERLDLRDTHALESKLSQINPDVVVHFAAQPGVRYSRINPVSYLDSNINALGSLVEAMVKTGCRKMIFAGSSSVYGQIDTQSALESAPLGASTSLYALTKRFGEEYLSFLEKSLDATSLRFFTVYGPWGRPDMAYLRFMAAMRLGDNADLFGDMSRMRDFTYIADVTASVLKVTTALLDDVELPSVINVGHGEPRTLAEMIVALEEISGASLNLRHLPADPQDVQKTCADFGLLQSITGSHPATHLEEGLLETWNWLKAIDPEVLRSWIASSH